MINKNSFFQRFSSLLGSKRFVGWITPDRLKLYPPHIPILLLIGWSVSQVMGPGLLDATGSIIGSDFIAFYTAGKFYLSGQMDKLYDLSAQYVFQKSIVSPLIYKGYCPYVNPPFVAPLFSLFANGSYVSGLILWWLFGLLLIFLSVLRLRSEMVVLKNRSIPKLLYLCFLFPSTLIWFTYAQNTPISLILYVLFFIFLRRRKDLIAGVALGLLLFKPQLALAPGLIVLINRRWSSFIGVIIGSGIWITTGLITTPKVLINYFQISQYLPNMLRLKPEVSKLTHFLGFDTSQLISPVWGIHSFFGFWSLLLDNVSTKSANVLYVITILSGVAYLSKVWSKLKWKPATKSWDLGVAGTFSLGLLLSPHLFTYDLMLLMLPMAIVWNHYPCGTGDRPLDGGLLLFWAALLYITTFVGPVVTLAQVKAYRLMGLYPKFALQFSTLILLGWAFAVLSVADGDKDMITPL